jgi:alcohol/geraniol dehydrogenase (NADP+)
MPIHAYAAKEAGGRVEPFDFEPGPLRPHEIEISVTHCGVCHSDVHLVDNDWGFSRYPMVPGHEIVGTVRAKGAEVRDHDEGDRVGVGWESSACLRCEWCLKGEEQLCAARQNTCLHCPGAFADAFRVDARFAFPIPKALSSAGAAPLLCGGITVYSPLQQYDVRTGARGARATSRSSSHARSAARSPRFRTRAASEPRRRASVRITSWMREATQRSRRRPSRRICCSSFPPRR